MFAERGLDVPIEDIARHAGVGVATLYRRFPTRADLIAGAFEAKMAAYADSAAQALAEPDPWIGFCGFLVRVCGMQAEDCGFANVLTMAFPTAKRFEAERDRAYHGLVELTGRAKATKALNLGIDREAFNKGIQFGNGNPSPSFWLPGTPYYDKSLEELAYNPEEAKGLLAEAGYQDGFTVTFPSFGALTQAAEAVQQMWAKIGVTVEIKQVEPGTLAKVMRDGKTLMTLTLTRGFTAESQYTERHAPGSPYDTLHTDRGDVAALATKALTAETQQGQNEGWRDVYSYLIKQGYLIVVAHEVPTVVAAENVKGVQLAPSDNLPKPYGISVG